MGIMLPSNSLTMISSRDLIKVLTTPSTADSFAAKIPTATEPSGDAVYDLRREGNLSFNKLLVIPLGSDANNETFDMRIWLWRKGRDSVWYPLLVAQLAVVLGNIDASAHGTNYFMADTITLTYGDSDTQIISEANDIPAYLIVDPRGSEYAEFDFDKGTAAAMNAMIAEF